MSNKEKSSAGRSFGYRPDTLRYSLTRPIIGLQVRRGLFMILAGKPLMAMSYNR